MKYIIINGPNLNLLGKRQTNIYGSKDFNTYFNELVKIFPKLSIEYFQSNIEGEIIDKLHEAGFTYNGIIINAGGYSHTSVSIADAISSIKTPVIEVHISNIYAREEYRHISLLSKNCVGVIAGFGLKSYEMALQYFNDTKLEKK